MDPQGDIATTTGGSAGDDSLRTITLITYALFAIGIFIGLTAVVGVIIAHVKRGDAQGTIYESHLTWLIRTFWIALAVSIVGLLTLVIGIGGLVMMASGLWAIYRVVKGFLRLNDRKPIDNPSAFF